MLGKLRGGWNTKRVAGCCLSSAAVYQSANRDVHRYRLVIIREDLDFPLYIYRKLV